MVARMVFFRLTASCLTIEPAEKSGAASDTEIRFCPLPLGEGWVRV